MLQAFPEALFHQLLLAMVSTDYETRIGAHRVFSVVLVPSSVCPRPSSKNTHSRKAGDIQRTLSRTASVFSSSAALFKKLGKEQDKKDNNFNGENTRNDNPSVLNRLTSSYSRAYSMKKQSSPEENRTSTSEQQSVWLISLDSIKNHFIFSHIQEMIVNFYLHKIFDLL